MKIKQFITAFIVILIIVVSAFATSGLGAVQGSGTSVIGIINADTTWTPAGSPYTLTGPTAVNTGVTLTIQPGVTVDLGSYYIQVNGTLTAMGSASNPIQFNGNGTLRFTPACVGWNDKTGTGCIVQYANIQAASISASNPVKLDQDVLFGVVVGDNSVLTNNNFAWDVTAGNSAVLTNNQIVNGSVNAGSFCSILNNNIGGSIQANDSCTVRGNTVGYSVICNGNQSTITDNTIGGQVNGGIITDNTISAYTSFTVRGTIVSNNIITNGTVSATQQITNNLIVSGTYSAEFRVFGGYASYTENTAAISGTVGDAPYIAGNIITGGGTYQYAFIFSYSSYPVPAIDFSQGGTANITNNVITSQSNSAISANLVALTNNVIIGDVNGSIPTVTNNTITGSLNLNTGTNTVSNNTVTSAISVNSPTWSIMKNTAQVITVTQGNGSITDNTVKSNFVTGQSGNVNGTDGGSSGTGINALGGNALIQRNIISAESVGVTVNNAAATIRNNTISGNGLGIALYTPASITINYNNLQGNNQNIALEQGTVNNVDATYNYWGTTDQSAIGQSIFDSRRDFNLGTVTFTPTLSAANPNAIPDPNDGGTAVTPTPTPTPTPTATPTPPPTQTPTPPTSTPTPAPTSTATTTPTASPTPTQTTQASTTPTPTAPAETLGTVPPSSSTTPTPTAPETPTFITVAALAIIAVVAILLTLRRRKQPTT